MLSWLWCINLHFSAFIKKKIFNEKKNWLKFKLNFLWVGVEKLSTGKNVFLILGKTLFDFLNWLVDINNLYSLFFVIKENFFNISKCFRNVRKLNENFCNINKFFLWFTFYHSTLRSKSGKTILWYQRKHS